MATGCTGRVGEIVTRVISLYNDEPQDNATDTRVVLAINEGIRWLAFKGVFTKTTGIDTVASQQEYDLWNLVEDLNEPLTLAWENGDDKWDMVRVETREKFDGFDRYMGSPTGSPVLYYIDSGKLEVLPTPDAAVTGGLQLYHSYFPDDVYCTTHKTLAGAAVDLTGGLVGIPCASHGFVAGDTVALSETTNYDTSYTLPAQTLGDDDNFVITATYQAETFASPDYAAKTSTPLITSPPTPRVYDSFYVFFALAELYERDNRSALADKNYQKYAAKANQVYGKLCSAKGQAGFVMDFPR